MKFNSTELFLLDEAKITFLGTILIITTSLPLFVFLTEILSELLLKTKDLKDGAICSGSLGGFSTTYSGFT